MIESLNKAERDLIYHLILHGLQSFLQRRNDLIPNVVNSVKGYMAHEEKLLTEITNARKEIGKAEIESGSNLDSSISKLIALAESNPGW